MTDFRALCAALIEEAPYESPTTCLARAALSQPEPEGLTDEELLRCYGLAKRDHCYEGPMDDWPKRAERAATVCGLRAVIAADRARWGRPALAPTPVSERPWERKGWCDNNGWCWGFNADDTDPFWIFDHRCWGRSGCWTHVLPHYALPIPTTTEKP